MSEHPFECVELKSEGWSYLAKDATGACRRQDYRNAYFYINGAIYITRTEFLIRSGKLVDEDSIGFYPMPRENSVDIDDEYDLLLARTLLAESLC